MTQHSTSCGSAASTARSRVIASSGLVDMFAVAKSITFCRVIGGSGVRAGAVVGPAANDASGNPTISSSNGNPQAATAPMVLEANDVIDPPVPIGHSISLRL